MWKEGVIGVPGKGGQMTGVWYQAKVYDQPSYYGIAGGRVSKLQLREGRRLPVSPGEIVANYDRGWDIDPKTDAARAALRILLDSFR